MISDGKSHLGLPTALQSGKLPDGPLQCQADIWRTHNQQDLVFSWRNTLLQGELLRLFVVATQWNLTKDKLEDLMTIVHSAQSLNVTAIDPTMNVPEWIHTAQTIDLATVNCDFDVSPAFSTEDEVGE